MAFQRPRSIELANELLDSATGTEDAEDAARDMARVQSTLTDQDNFGVGIHAHWINEWLKKIAESR